MNDAPTSYIDLKAEAHRDPGSVPLHEIDVSNPCIPRTRGTASSLDCGQRIRCTSSTALCTVRTGR